MKDDLESCIAFLKEVQQNPALYDQHSHDYSNRRAIESIWSKIGEKFNEPDTECKNKWKIIRSSYVRSLKMKTKGRSKAGPKKEYYLGPYLRFLHPFIKNSPQDENIKIPYTRNISIHEKVEFVDFSNSQDEDQSMSSSETGDETKAVGNRNKGTSSGNTQNGIKTQTTSNDAVDQCVKKVESEMKTTTEKEPCEHFLLSIVPYMKSMSQTEQLSFQKGVLSLIETIIISRKNRLN